MSLTSAVWHYRRSVPPLSAYGADARKNNFGPVLVTTNEDGTQILSGNTLVRTGADGGNPINCLPSYEVLVVENDERLTDFIEYHAAAGDLLMREMTAADRTSRFYRLHSCRRG